MWQRHCLCSSCRPSRCTDVVCALASLSTPEGASGGCLSFAHKVVIFGPEARRVIISSSCLPEFWRAERDSRNVRDGWRKTASARLALTSSRRLDPRVAPPTGTNLAESPAPTPFLLEHWRKRRLTSGRRGSGDLRRLHSAAWRLRPARASLTGSRQPRSTLF